MRETLKKKCGFKDVPVPTMTILEASAKKKEMIEEWDRMLAHQIADLEPYERYWERLPKVFEWLEN